MQNNLEILAKKISKEVKFKIIAKKLKIKRYNLLIKASRLKELLALF